MKQEEFEQERVSEHGKYAQTPLADAYDVHNSVSLGKYENSDAQSRDENSASATDKFLVMI